MPAAKPPPSSPGEQPEPSFSPAVERLLAGVGARLRSLRGARKLTQDQLGQLTNTARTYINAVESGRKNVRLETLARFAAALGVEMADLIPPRAEFEQGDDPNETAPKGR